MKYSNRLIILVYFGMFIASLGLSACLSGYSDKAELITIGQNPNETKALFYIAEERGFLDANGINVEYKNYDSGAETVTAALRGDVDLATCSEFVIVVNALEKKPVLTIADISKFQNAYIVGRVDKGIKNKIDLRGKRIGVASSVSAQYYLGRFLEINGMNIRQVTSVEITNANSVNALVNGDTDALAVIEPFASMAKERLGDNAVIWPAQLGLLTHFNIVCTDTWAQNHQDTINRLLKALVQAENYVVDKPVEAMNIVKERLNYDDAYINANWPEYLFSVTLSQSMITAMEDEARWLINNNLTSEKLIPHFEDYVYGDALKAIKPWAVNIR